MQVQKMQNLLRMTDCDQGITCYETWNFTFYLRFDVIGQLLVNLGVSSDLFLVALGNTLWPLENYFDE